MANTGKFMNKLKFDCYSYVPAHSESRCNQILLNHYPNKVPPTHYFYCSVWSIS